MSVQSQCRFHFLALWGDTEREDDRSGREGGQGSDRGEQQAASLGDVHTCCYGYAEPGKQNVGHV